MTSPPVAEATLPESLSSSILPNSKLDPQGECVVWTGPRIRNGYGRYYFRGRQYVVHRVAWESVNGPIAEGMVVNHRCWNKSCCNPDHLELASLSENGSYREGAQKNSLSGFRNVSPHGSGWKVQIRKDGELHYFGTYRDKLVAHDVAEEKRRELFGRFAGNG